MMRHICSRCHYPDKTCICDHVETITCSTEIIVLQHPEEIKNAKGTVRLLSLSLPNLQCFVGETSSDFDDVAQKISAFNGQIYLLFPCDESVALEQVFECKNNRLSALEQKQLLIVIDGTWRKALKIYKQNPWLQSLQAYHFSQNLASNYYIRRSAVESGVSSLEAVAYFLELVEGINSQPLHNLFDYMQQQQIKLMPEDVKQRYR